MFSFLTDESFRKVYKLAENSESIMKISELKPGQGSVELTGEVIEVGEARTFNKFGSEGRVATAVMKDESGQIMLSLWNDQIDKVKQGDTVTIKNGYVKEWQGELQITTGKMGTLEVGTPTAKPEEAKEGSKEETKTVEESLG